MKVFNHCLSGALSLPAKSLVIFLEECPRVNIETDTFFRGKEGEQVQTFQRVKKADQAGHSFDGGRSYISGHWSCQKSGDGGGEEGEGVAADEGGGEGGVGEER